MRRLATFLAMATVPLAGLAGCGRGPERPSDLEYLFAQYRCELEHARPTLRQLDSLLNSRKYQQATDLAARAVDSPEECFEVSVAFDVAECGDLATHQSFKDQLSVERCQELRAQYRTPSDEPEPGDGIRNLPGEGGRGD